MEKNITYVDFADLKGSYDEVTTTVTSILRNGFLVRKDAFDREGEVHRVYLTDREQYPLLADLDTFPKNGTVPG